MTVVPFMSLAYHHTVGCLEIMFSVKLKHGTQAFSF